MHEHGGWVAVADGLVVEELLHAAGMVRVRMRERNGLDEARVGLSQGALEERLGFRFVRTRIDDYGDAALRDHVRVHVVVWRQRGAW